MRTLTKQSKLQAVLHWPNKRLKHGLEQKKNTEQNQLEICLNSVWLSACWKTTVLVDRQKYQRHSLRHPFLSGSRKTAPTIFKGQGAGQEFFLSMAGFETKRNKTKRNETKHETNIKSESANPKKAFTLPGPIICTK